MSKAVLKPASKFFSESTGIEELTDNNCHCDSVNNTTLSTSLSKTKETHPTKKVSYLGINNGVKNNKHTSSARIITIEEPLS